MTSILLTGIGLDGGPDIVRALRSDSELAARIIGIDVDPLVATRFACDEFYVAPARGTPSYVEHVFSRAEAADCKVIYPLPTFDQELFAAAVPRAREKGFAVPVSPVEAVRICNDKWATYCALSPKLPEAIAPHQLAVTTEEFVAAAHAMGYPGRPVCARRRVSRGGIGMRILDPTRNRVQALLGQHPGSSPISLAEFLDVCGQAEVFPEYIVQEFLPGEEWDVDVLCRYGESVVVATRRNLTMLGGGAMHAVLERDDEIEDLCRRIVADLRLHAVVNLSFKRDMDGRPRLMEINPRVPSSILSALSCGINLVSLAVRQELGEALVIPPLRWGGRFIRYFRSVILDPEGATVAF